MKSSDIKEILVLTNTSFSRRQLCEINIQQGSSNLTPGEQLEAACWNGLLEEMLPEIMQRRSHNDKLFIWQVETGKSFVRISMGVCLPVPEIKFTLDPHVFLSQQDWN